jgi:glycosyltransferase involved in cell wall biosynthesis
VVANSEAVRRDFAWWRRLKEKTRVIHPGIPSEGDAGVETSDMRTTWGIQPDEFVVGFVGQITPIKRVDDAVLVFDAFRRERPRARLVIVGAPKFRAENKDYLGHLQQMVRQRDLSDRVVFAGFQERMVDVYRTLDVLLHPAEHEGFGRVIVEAMAQGVPVIATRDGGIPEIVREGSGGYLVPVGDVTAMADLLRRLAGDVALRHEVGAAGRARAREFEWDRIVPQLVQTYAELVPH